MKMKKKDLREIYKDHPQTLFMLGISVEDNGDGEEEYSGDLDMILETEYIEIINDLDNSNDDTEILNGDEDLKILEEEGY